MKRVSLVIANKVDPMKFKISREMVSRNIVIPVRIGHVSITILLTTMNKSLH